MLKTILVFFAILTEGYIIYLQFFYVIYIIIKKKEVRKLTGKVWGYRTRALIVWLYCVLVINALKRCVETSNQYLHYLLTENLTVDDWYPEENKN